MRVPTLCVLAAALALVGAQQNCQGTPNMHPVQRGKGYSSQERRCSTTGPHPCSVCAECVRVCVPSRLTLCVFDSPATLPPAEPPQFTSSTTNGMRFKVGNMTPALTVCGGRGRKGRLCVGIVLGAGVGG